MLSIADCIEKKFASSTIFNNSIIATDSVVIKRLLTIGRVYKVFLRERYCIYIKVGCFEVWLQQDMKYMKVLHSNHNS